VIPEKYLEVAAGRLSDDGVEVTKGQLGGLPVLIGYRSRFRWLWMGTRLHVLTVIATPPGPITGEHLQNFTDAVLDHAIASKGQWRGLQSGVAVIPAMVGEQVSPEAEAFATTRVVKKFAAFAWPVVVDLSTGTVHSHQGRVAIGGIYAGYLRQQIALALPVPSA
jgi:hypothetical protein